MRASRLLGILLTLQTRPRVSASALARIFEVSTRTIYRDIDALSAAGVPIYAETGRNGGVSLHEGYRTRLTGLTLSEASALPVAGLAHAARDLGLSEQAASAQLKVLASLSPDTGAAAQRIAERFYLDAIPWYHRAETLPLLPKLAQAVWTGNRIAIAYESWKGGVKHRLDPLGLVQKGGLWYLVAVGRQKPHTYRVSNISALDVLEAPAQRPTAFDLASYWRDSAARFERTLMAHRALVLITEEGERILRATMPAAAEAVSDTRAPSAREGWSRAEMPFESPEYSARQILRLGAEIEVLAPPDLRAAVIHETRAILKSYRKNSKRVRTP
jgi:predicted DNA-binding transcriptional regulator YafY